MANPFADINLWLTLIGTSALLLGAAEFGLRTARRHAAADRLGSKENIAALQAAALGLLALLTGFTFSMALTRFEARTAIIVDEANAIGTALLRANLLPQPQARETIRLLRDYTAQRTVHEGSNPGLAATDPFSTRAAATHDQLWRLVEAAVAADPRPVTTGLYIPALNEMIDLHSKRVAGLRNGVPPVVFALLYMIAAVALGFTGYHAELNGVGQRVANGVMATMLAAVILLVVDLDSARHGLMTISQQPLIDLRASFPSP